MKRLPGNFFNTFSWISVVASVGLGRNGRYIPEMQMQRPNLLVYAARDHVVKAYVSIIFRYPRGKKYNANQDPKTQFHVL